MKKKTCSVGHKTWSALARCVFRSRAVRGEGPWATVWEVRLQRLLV